MKIEHTALPGILILEASIHRDDRGIFFESFNRKTYQELGLSDEFVQDNQSRSKQGVLRGLHYQLPHAQGKLVRAVAGEIYDVAVDLRRTSPTFAHWIGLHLSGTKNLQLWVPPGFAHGYYVLSDWADVVYKVTGYYNPETEWTLSWNDPQVGIEWPLIDGRPPLLSPKDGTGRLLADLKLFD